MGCLFGLSYKTGVILTAIISFATHVVLLSCVFPYEKDSTHIQAMSIVNCILSFFLLIGAIKGEPKLILPWIIETVVIIAVLIAAIVCLNIQQPKTSIFADTSEKLVNMIIALKESINSATCGIITGVHIFFIHVVITYYRKVRKEIEAENQKTLDLESK